MDQGEYALQLAVRANALRLVKLLLRFEGDVNKKDINNHTALTMAVCLRNFEILEILLLSPDLDKEMFQSALDYAIHKKSSPTLMSLLETRKKSSFSIEERIHIG